MRSGKQRRAELKVKKALLRATALQKVQLNALARGVAVDRSLLAPDGSCIQPEFVKRGYYVDKPFECRDFGEPQTWTAAQQKWWYEVAKGGVRTTATRCRPCRLRERTRRAEARRLSLEGLARKGRTDD